MVACGDSFLSGDDEYEDYHLNVVITPPSAGEVITVSITTLRKRSEKLVIVRPGEHPFVIRDSVVAYIYSRIRKVADIESAIEADNAKPRNAVTPELLARIRKGFLESEFTPNGVRQLYKMIMSENKGLSSPFSN
jgi:hypothetical protein